MKNSKISLMFSSRCSKEASSPRPDNLALIAIENTATIKDSRASSVSQPIPVPSQIHNYEKMQESKDRTKSLGGVSASSPSGSPFDGIFRSKTFLTFYFSLAILDRRASLDRLRQASIASSNSDLANSISPPAVRFTADGAAASANPFSLVPSARRISKNDYYRKNEIESRLILATTPPPSRAIQHSASNSSLVQQQNSKLVIDASPLKSRQKLTDIDSKYSSIKYLQRNSFVFVDPHDRFFEQENNIEFFTTNIEPQSVAGPIRRRVSSLFGETKSEGRYYEPQKITDDALMDVCIHFPFPKNKTSTYFSLE